MFGQFARMQPIYIANPIQPRLRLIPLFPYIDKGLRLCAILGSLVVVNLEIIAFGIERRVDIAQIDRIIRDLAAQDIQIVAIKQLVLRGG